jgi:hypothetical protein
MGMLYGIDGKPLGQQEDTATRLYHVQLMNMLLFQRDTLMGVVRTCESALEKMNDPKHQLHVRMISQIAEKAKEATENEAVSGFISGTQARLAYEICERLVAEAKLFDEADSDEPTTECQELMQTLIARMLTKLAPADESEAKANVESVVETP